MLKNLINNKAQILGFLRMKRSAVVSIIATIFIIFGVRVWSLYGDAQIKLVSVTLTSSIEGTAQLYYDLGQGFSEKDMSPSDIDDSPIFKEYHFPIPNVKIHHLRFDPLTSIGHVEIQRIRIADGLGNTFLNVDLKQLEPAHQIRKLTIGDSQLSVDMDDHADDPQINIVLPAPLSFKRLHNAVYLILFRDFFAILFLGLIIYLWLNWRDPKNIKKWICYGLITLVFATVLIYFFQSCRDILSRSISSFEQGDTNVYSHLVAKKWTSSDFYQGLRHFSVPLLYSLINGEKNTINIILLQTVLSYVSWTFLAFTVACVLKDYLTKAIVFCLIALIPVNYSIYSWNMVILGGSISFSFLALFLGACLWYYKTGSIPSSMFLVFIASIVAIFISAILFIAWQNMNDDGYVPDQRAFHGNAAVVTITPWGQRVQHDLSTYIEMEKYVRLAKWVNWVRNGKAIWQDINEKVSTGKLIIENPPTRLLAGLWALNGDGQQRIYLIDTGNGLLLVDPGYDDFRANILKQIKQLGYDIEEVKWVLITHRHLDHAQSIPYWQEQGKQIFIHSADLNQPATDNEMSTRGLLNKNSALIIAFNDGDVLKFGNLSLWVIHTPGHTQGASCFYFQREGRNVLLSGDIVLHLGRQAWMGDPNSDWDQYLKSLYKIKHFTTYSDADKSKTKGKPIEYDLMLPGHGTISLNMGSREVDCTIQLVAKIVKNRQAGVNLDWIDSYQYYWERK
jgi:hydroxyacylglutathione hydrolase